MSAKRDLVVIAGGSGFVGRALAGRLRRDCNVRALSRSGSGQAADGLEHVACDLFSLLQTERALVGARRAVYLVHSMSPTDRLTQASFAELDLIMADNFARACAGAGVERIVYLGGLIPNARGNGDLSEHLASRLETERVLASHGVPVTAVRAGLILGAGGSSFQILSNLVRRLPLMICPRWTLSQTQAVALDDVVEVIAESLEHSKAGGRILNVGTPEVVSYQELMRATAEAMGRTLRIMTVPVNSVGLSRLWVRLFSGASGSLVDPLVESLKDSMIAEPNHLADRGISLRVALAHAVQDPMADSRPTAPPVATPRPTRPRTVRSVQRLVLPKNTSARWVSRRYFVWLQRVVVWPLKVIYEHKEGRARIVLGSLLLLELTLSPRRSSDDRVLLYITGGLLCRHRGAEDAGRLEFRSVLEGRYVMVALHDFRPGLPFFLYRPTQARLHLWVMRRFARYLARRKT